MGTKKAAGGRQPEDNSLKAIISQGNRTISEFFQCLYGENASGWLTIWTLKDKRTRWHNIENLQAITKECDRLKSETDVYFGVGLRKAKLKPSQRGDAKDIKAIPGVWLDLDIKDSAHSAKNLPELKDIIPFISNYFDLPPTMLVHSGYGIHCYWLFDSLFELDTEENNARADGLLKQFQAFFIGAARRNKWHIDNTSDLPRILRVPGTLNHKKETPVPVVLKGMDPARRYTVEQLEGAIRKAEGDLVQLPPLEGHEQESVAARQTVHKSSSTNETLPSTWRIIEQCGFISHCVEDAASLTEPEWYKMTSILGRTENGRQNVHDLSAPHPGYDHQETEKKIEHALQASAPFTCTRIMDDHGSEWCANCVHRGQIKSPISLGYERRIDAARRTVADALEKAFSGDVGAPLEPLVVGALALIEKEDPAAFVRLKSELKKAKVPSLELTRALKKQKKERLRVVSPGDTEKPLKLAGSMIDDCPVPELAVPEQYSLTGTRVYRNIVKNAGKEDQYMAQIPVALAPVLITGLYRDITTGKESIKVTWKRANKWLTAIIDRDVAMNVRGIVSLAGEGFPVTSGSSGELTSYLALLEAENMHRLPIAHVTNQLGWQGKGGSLGFLWGRTFIHPDGTEVDNLDIDSLTPGEWREDLISFRGVDEGDEQIADGFHRRGTMENWLEAIKIVSKYPKALLAFYTAFVPPLLNILRCDNFILEYARRTSTGKSVTQRVAASVFGNPDERTPDSVMQTWGIKPAWLGRASAVISGLPLILDDTKRAKPEFVVDATYMITGGKDTGRATIKGLAVTKTWRTVLISSGEVKSTSFKTADKSSNGGTKGRTLIISSLPFEGDGPEEKKVVETVNRIVCMNYGYAMPLFLKWVMQHKDKWSSWEEAFRNEGEKYAARVSGNVAGRLSKYVAAIDVTAALVHAAFRDMGYELPFKYKDPFGNGLWEEIAKESEDATGEEQALRDFLGWAHANETSFLGRQTTDLFGVAKPPSGGWFGKWDREKWDYIAVYPDRLKRFIRDNDYPVEETLIQWKERGWLAVDKGYQKQVRIDGSKTYLICIKREAIESI